jgi:hypothetical protein
MNWLTEPNRSPVSGRADRPGAEDVARCVSRTGSYLFRFMKRMKRMKREPVRMAEATLSAKFPPGGQGVFVGVLYPVRQTD